ncbi:MAG TPA: DUF1080 domain-containing protein [Fimbriimonadaceae bacterium]|nr:DUF1080 domain-containing protein [Fimbriimonadaceae bacterium]
MIVALTAMVLMQHNTLSFDEARSGWRLLFDGKSTRGWHNFKASGIRPGWKVEDGVLMCADPSNAGDIVSNDKFDWFELELDFNIARGGNSGVMYHVADDGEATWHSGPEIQIYDHPAEPGTEITGYLYQLYTAPHDASRPSGEWNHMRVVVAPDKCYTEINGVRYYEYVLGSKDFRDRVAKSKFAVYPKFGKLKRGTLAIQGDHGVVSFRDIKIRPIKTHGPDWFLG